MQFSILPSGNIANRMLAFMVALAVGRHFSEEVSYNCGLPEIGREFDQALHDRLHAEGAYVARETEVFSVPELVARIREAGARSVIFRGFFQRFELFEPAGFYRDVLIKKQQLDIAPFAENDIVINIRAAEILAGGVYWYPLVPVNFYVKLIRETGYDPVFLGQLDDCQYVREIAAAFPKARMVPSGGAMTDFNRLMNAKRICIAVSTFSWLAAWLSDAVEIHYPLLGFLHPFCLPKGALEGGGNDLTPLRDGRYRYHLLPVLNAEPEGPYLRHTAALNPISMAVGQDFVAALSEKAKRRYGTINTAKHARYLKQHPDAAWLISLGLAESAVDHFRAAGEAHGYPLLIENIPRPAQKNLARGKPATQSSVSAWSAGYARETDAAGAVDGEIDGYYSFHTDIEERPWWRVDLGESCEIAEVWVFNRIEHAVLAVRANRLAIEIGVGEDDYEEVFRYDAEEAFGGADGKPLVFKPERPVVGRYVRIRLLERNYLHLEQVEVYGTPLG